VLTGGGALAAGWVVGQVVGHWPLRPVGSPFLGSAARTTLAAALEALLPDGAPVEPIASDVDRFLAGSDPVLGGQLVLALTVLEHTAGVGLLSFRRFSRLDRQARVAVLEGWRTSSVGLRRQIADAVRRLALFSWYTRPESWARIGYDGPWVQLPSAGMPR
jgi:hypothetical protein